MNFTNCHVTIHSVNNYATITVSDPSNNTIFDISASNTYTPYYTYQPAYNGSNVCYHPVYNSNSFGPTDLSGGRVSANSLGPSTQISDFPRSMYSYYN